MIPPVLRSAVLVLLAVAVCSGAPVMAGEQPVPSRQWTPAHGPDPEGALRAVTEDDATTTSDCIGELVAPLCAIDTLMACYIRNEEDLCGLALNVKPEFRGLPHPWTYNRYRVSAVGTFGKDNPRGHVFQVPEGKGAEAGDLLVEVIDQFCHTWTTGEEVCSTGHTSFTYALRRSGGGWHITANFFEGPPLAVRGSPVPSRQWTPAHGPDAEGVWRTVTQEDATSTSDCIGDQGSPLCVIDTYVACRVRPDAKLCLLVLGYPAAWLEISSPPSRGHYEMYRITAVHTAPVAGRFPFRHNLRFGPYGEDIKVGDLLVDVIDASCWEPDEGETPEYMCFDPIPVPTTLALRRIDGRWYFVDDIQPRL